MKTVVGRDKYLAIALATVALLLIGVLAWEWDQGMRLERELLKLRNIPVVPAKPLNILPEFVLPAEETAFPELVSRSLFSTTRRSSAVAVKGGNASMKKGQYVLVGVLITPKQRSVQLRDVQTGKAETVALNGVVRGMTVGDVEASRVILRQGAESEELILNVQTGPKSGVGARTPAPAVPASAAPPPAPPTPVASAPARVASEVAAPASAPVAPPAAPSRVDSKRP